MGWLEDLGREYNEDTAVKESTGDWLDDLATFEEPETNVLSPVTDLFKGIYTGFTRRLPEQIGQALRFSEIAPETGESITEWAREGEDTTQQKGDIFKGAEALPSSVVPTAAINVVGKAISFIPHPIAKVVGLGMQGLSYVAAPLLFGLSQAQETKDTGEKRIQDLEKQIAAASPEERALLEDELSRVKENQTWAPYATGGFEMGGETIANWALLRLLGPLAPAGKLAEQTVKRMFKPTLGRYVQQLAFKTLPAEVFTEMAQNASEAMVEKDTGIRPTADPWGEALEAIGPTTVMTLLMGGGGRVLQTHVAGNYMNTLSDAKGDPAKRSVISDSISQIIREDYNDPQTAALWDNYAKSRISKGEDIDPETMLDAESLVPDLGNIIDEAKGETSNIDQMAEKVVDDLAATDPLEAAKAKGIIEAGPSTEEFKERFTAKETGMPQYGGILKSLYESIAANDDRMQGISHLVLDEYIARGGIIPVNRPDLALKYPEATYERNIKPIDAGEKPAPELQPAQEGVLPVGEAITPSVEEKIAGEAISAGQRKSPEQLKPDVPGAQTALEPSPKEGVRAKQPWEMTREEFWQQPEAQRIYGSSPEKNKKPYLSLHKIEVEEALSEGKPVPPEVLKEYPELKVQAKAPAPAEKKIFPRNEPTHPETLQVFKQAIENPSEENIAALVAQAKRFNDIERDVKGNIKRNWGYRLFKRALGEIPGKRYPEWEALGAKNATEFWNKIRFTPGVEAYQEALSETDFPSEKEIIKPTEEILDKSIEVFDHNIQGIREELYEDNYTKSEVSSIIDSLSAQYQGQSAGAEFEARLAELKEEVRAARTAEVNPPEAVTKAESGQELFDTSKMFTLSGAQPFTRKEFKPGEQKGDRMFEVEKQTTGELLDRLTGEKAKREHELESKPKEFLHDYSSTQVDLPKPEAKAIIDFGKSIPDSEIFTDPNDPTLGKEDKPHITVKYGIHTGNPKEIETIIKDEGLIRAKLGKVDVFTPEDKPYDVVIVHVESKQLHSLNDKISKGTEVTDTYPKYTPHVTVAYVKKGEGEKYKGDTRFQGKEITFDNVFFRGKDERATKIELAEKGGKPKLTYEEFAKAYRDAFEQGQKYTPQQAGFRTYADAMAALADEYPEHMERFDKEIEGEKTDETKLSQESITALLNLPLSDHLSAYGNTNITLRKQIMKELTGKDVPLSKAGAGAVYNALLKEAGIVKKDQSAIAGETELRKWLEGLKQEKTQIQEINPEFIITADQRWDATIGELKEAWYAAMAHADQVKEIIDKKIEPLQEELDELRKKNSKEAKTRKKFLTDQIKQFKSDIKGLYDMYEVATLNEAEKVQEEAAKRLESLGIPAKTDEYDTYEEFYENFANTIDPENGEIEYTHSKTVNELFVEEVGNLIDEHKDEPWTIKAKTRLDEYKKSQGKETTAKEGRGDVRFLQTLKGEPVARILQLSDQGRGMGTYEVVEWLGGAEKMPFSDLTYREYFEARVDKRLINRDRKVVREGAKIGYIQLMSGDAKYISKMLTEEKIEDFGEKIGGARKDTAERGYTMTKAEKKEETEPAWKKRYVAMEKVDGSGTWVIHDTKSDTFVRSGYKEQTFTSQAEAEKAIPLYAVAKTHVAYPSSKTQKWEIFKRVGERKLFKVVNKEFDSREDAMKYMASNAEEILAIKTTFGEEIFPVPDKVTRKGAERRTGNADAETFTNTFGFRGVEFGNWNNQQERQEVMNHAYDGLLDLAEVLDVEPKALSLNGELALAFGARGQGLSGARAHYERDYGVINLTKMSGAGSLAHEWFHALDHYFGRQDTKASSEKEKNIRGDLVYKTKGAVDYLSHGARYKSQLRPKVEEAYRNLIDTIFKKAEQYVEDTQKADEFVGKAREYLGNKLDAIRKNIERDFTKEYTWRKNTIGLKPASAEQLAEFDRLANILIEGGNLETHSRRPEKAKSAWTVYYTNDTLDGISAILKAVRNRSGFNAEHTGTLDSVRDAMKTYSERLKLLSDAKAGTEKTKKVPTSYALEAKKMDQARAGNYWSEPHEMAARAFASYVEDKIAEKGGQSDFLVYHAHGGILLPMIDGFVARPYPEGKEREAINAAFSELIKTIETKETDKGIAFFSKEYTYRIIRPMKPIFTVAALKEQLRPVLVKLSKQVDTKIEIIQNNEGFPREFVERAGSSFDIKNDKVYGAWDPKTNTLYLVADSLPSAASAERVIIEELVGHKGLNSLLAPSELNKIRFSVYHQFKDTDGMKKVVRDYRIDTSTANGRAKAGDEYMVHNMKSVYDKPTLMRKIAAFIRAALRRIGFKLEYGTEDIQILMNRAWDHMKKGKVALKGAGGVFFGKEEADSMNKAFAERLDKYLAGKMEKDIAIVVTDTPKILESLGAKQLPVTISDHAINKVMSDVKHSIPLETLKQLPSQLHDPIAVFDSSSEQSPNSFIVMTELRDKDGDTIIAAVHLSKTVGHHEVNSVASVYGKDRNKWFQEQIDRGRLRYINEEKALNWSQSVGRLFSPNEAINQGSKTSILTEKDFVKPEDKEPMFRKELATEPSIDDSSEDFKTKFNDQVHGIKTALAEGMGSPLWREILGSPEWHSHPVMQDLVKLFTDRRSELYHDRFNYLIDADKEKNIVDELHDLKYKGMNLGQKAKAFISGETSEDYKLLENIIDEGDTKKITPEKMEKLLRDRNTPDDVIYTWKRLRESWDKALDLMKGQVETLIKERLGSQGPLPGMKAITEQLRDALAMMEEWRGSYAPRIRPPGNYVLQATRGEGKEKEYFRTHGSARQMDILASQMRRKGWATKVDKLQRLPESTYQNVKTVEVANLIEYSLKNIKDPVLKAEMNDEVIQLVADTIRARGYRQTMIHRGKKLITGYITDPMERYLRYTNSLAGGLSKAEVARQAMDVFKEIDPAKEPQIHRAAKLYVEENLRNIERVDRAIGLAKSIATFKFLGFNLRSIGVNVSAVATTAPPAIQQYALSGKGSMVKIVSSLGKAGADYAKFMAGKKLDDEGDQRFLEIIKKEGYDDPQYSRDAMGKMQKLQGKLWGQIMSGSMYLFGKSEQWNRGTTMLAAFRLAKAQGMPEVEAMEKAREASNRAHGIYGKGTLPFWAMGENPAAKVGQMMYVYGKFGHNYVQMLYDLGMKRHNIKAFLWAAISPMVVAGATVFPFREEIMFFIRAILRAAGFDDDPEKFVWDHVRKNLGKEAEIAGRHGLTGLAGVDISGSLSIGVGIPKGLLDLTGAIGGVGEDIIKAMNFLNTGQPLRAVEKGLPTGIGNVLRAAREGSRGVTTERGKPVWTEEGKQFKPSTGQTAMRALGFRSSEQATITERTQEAKKVEQRFTDKRSEIYEAYRAWLGNPDKKPGDFKEIFEKIKDYNQKVIDKKLRKEVPLINAMSLRSQAKSVTKPTTKERLRLMER